MFSIGVLSSYHFFIFISYFLTIIFCQLRYLLYLCISKASFTLAKLKQ